MRRLVTAVLLVLGAVACNPPSDLNNPCRLSIPDPNNDGGLIFLTPTSSIVTQSTFSQFDFVSSGDSDCEDLLCIRVANPVSGYYDDSTYEEGRCSNTCIVDQSNNHSTDCGEQEKGLICRQLALDQSFINSFCSSNPGGCNSLFGTNDPSATYCVDPLASMSSGSSG